MFLDTTAYVEVARIASNASAELKKINGGTMLLIPQMISKSMIAESIARGGSPMTAGLQDREQLCKSLNIPIRGSTAK